MGPRFNVSSERLLVILWTRSYPFQQGFLIFMRNSPPKVNLHLNKLPFGTLMYSNWMPLSSCNNGNYCSRYNKQKFSLTHSLIHHFQTTPNSKKLQTTTKMCLLKEFSDTDYIENIMEKGKIAHFEQFHLFPQCFLRDFFFNVLNWVYMEESVKFASLSHR